MIALLAIAALSGPPPERVQVVIDVLEAIRRGERPCTDLVARYHDGDETVGTTTVRIAKGWVRVIRKEPDAEKATYRGRLPKGMCQAIIKNVIDARLWRARSKRKRAVPDETRPQITIGAQGVKPFKVRMWGFTVQNNTAFAIARSQLIQVARVVSKLKVLY